MGSLRLHGAPAAAAVVLWSTLSLAANDPVAAREQLKLGYNLAQDGKCGEAIPHLAESLRLDPKAITLINLADCEEKTGRFAAAMGHWVDARSRAQTEGAKAIEEEATDRAKALEPRLPRLTIVLTAGAPVDTTVERDGVVLGAPSLGVPMPVDAGAHVVVVKAPGHADARTELTTREAEAKRIEVAVGPAVAVVAAPSGPPRPAPERPARTNAIFWAGLGTAVAGAAVGTVTGLAALSAGSDADGACPALRCSSAAFDDVESGRRMATVSTVAFAVAGVGVAVAAYGFFVAPRTRRTAWVLPAFTGLRGTF